MITRETPIDSHWYRAAAIWFIAFFGATCIAFPALSTMGRSTHALRSLVWLGAGGTAVLLLTGMFRPKKPTRVLEFILVMGGFGLVPLLLAMGFAGLCYFLLTPDETWLVWSVPLASGVVAVAWCWRELKSFRRRIADRSFVEKEFGVEANRISVSRTPRTSLDPTPERDSSLRRRVIDRIGPRLLLLLPIGYPLQALLRDAGGVQFVLLGLSVVMIPWTIHALSQVVCGFYLWVYRVWKLERTYGLPVVFKESLA
jgi:hypothetical protein